MLESILDATDAAIDTFVFDAWVSFNAAANDWITGLMVLFVIVLGYLMLIGRLQLSLADLFPKLFKLAFIYVLVTNVALLISIVFSLFTDVPEAIATALLTTVDGSATGINTSVGVIYDRGLQSAALLWNNGGLTNPGPILLAAVVWLVTLLTVGYVTFLLMLAKLAVAVLLALAPFFLLLYLFDASRPLFEGWLRQVITFALIPVLTYAMLLLIITILDAASAPLIAAASAGTASLTQIAPFALVMAAAFLLSTQVLGWAGGVAGGFSLSTMGAYGRAMGGAAAVAGAGLGGAAAAAGAGLKRVPVRKMTSALANRIRNRSRADLSAGSDILGQAQASATSRTAMANSISSNKLPRLS